MSKIISLNELSLYSPWPARLLGLEKFPQKMKNNDELWREYQDEKWEPLLQKVKAVSQPIMLRQVNELFFNHDESVYFRRGEFALAKPLAVYNENVAYLDSVLIPWLSKGQVLVEIGAGYGGMILNLAKKHQDLDLKLVALEFAPSGLELIKLIATGENLPIAVGGVDINKTPLTELTVPSSAVIFTSWVTGEIATVKPELIDNLINLKPKVVVHFEPLFEHCDNTLHGLLCKKYIEINDYNRNLLSIIKTAQQAGKLKIIQEEPVVFGSNPLSCYSVLIWQPL